MKKAISLVLALLLAFSVFTVSFAKEEHRFHFGWEQPDFDFDFDFDFDDDHKDDHHQKPATPTDAPDFDDHDKQDRPEKPQDKPNQGRPENPAQRPQGGNCHPGDENCPDRVTDTDVTGTDVKDIFDAIKHLKEKGHHGKDFRLPKSNDKFFIIGMVIKEDGTIEFIFIEKGNEHKGEQRFPACKDDVTGTDVTATDAPDGMDFIELGDTDVDGKINAKDALKILKHAVKKAMMEHEGQQFLADMNEDGAIDAKDALKVLRKAVGKKD